MMHENRDYTRITFNRLIRVSLVSGETKHLIGINYSVTGIALRGKTPYSVSEIVGLKFRLDDDVLTELDIKGEVVHNIKQGEVYTIGLRFV